MADVKLAYGTSTAITITLANLASSATAGRESTAVDNGTNKYLDALVTVVLNVITGSIANDKAAYIWAYGSEDGTIFTDNATGTDAAITPEDPTCLRLVQVVPMPTALKAYEVVFSIAQAFGGVLPRKWGIVVRNYCGLALAATGSSASYSGIYETVA
jgi:hypothetical protein